MPLPSFTRQTDDPAAHTPTIYDAHAATVNEMMDEIEPMAASSPHPRYANVETLSGNKTLADSDLPIQSLDPNGADRNITLPAAANTNHAFFFWNRSASNNLTVKNSGGSTVATIPPASGGWVLPDGTTGWIQMGGGGSGSGFWTAVPGSPTRVSDTQFTITDTGGANNYASLFAKGVILKWDESGTFQTAMVQDSSYAADTVTINILGDSLTAGFTAMKYASRQAMKFEFIVPGTLGTGTDVARTHWPECDIYKLAVDARVKTAGTTNSTDFDVNDDGVTIITTKPSIASGATSDLNNVCDSPSTPIAAGSALTLDIDAVSTTPPDEAYVTLYYYPAYWRYLS